MPPLTTWPTSSTPPAPPGNPKARDYPPQRGTLVPRHGCLVSILIRTISGRCFTPTPSTSRSGRFGERLLYGGKLVIVPHAISRSPQEFAALLVRHQVTVLNQTPSAFRQLMPMLTDSAITARAHWRCACDFRRRSPGVAEPQAVVRAPRRRESAAHQHVWHHRNDRPRHLSADYCAPTLTLRPVV